MEKERALGRQVSLEVRRQSKPLDNPVVDAYAKRIGGELIAHLKERRFDYLFEVIVTDAVTEPLSIAGGYILIPARAFLAARDEAEFVGILAHSIGHLALQHGKRSATRGDVMEMGRIPLIFMGGWMGLHADSQRPNPQVPVGFFEAQRAYELEADAFGLELTSRAGYSGAAFRKYIERTQTADSKMSALPARDLRLAKIDELLQALPIVASSSTGEFQQIQEAVRASVPQPQARRTPTLLR